MVKKKPVVATIEPPADWILYGVGQYRRNAWRVVCAGVTFVSKCAPADVINHVLRFGI